MRLPDSLLAPLEIALNRYLAEDPGALERLSGQGDRVMALQLREFDATIFLRPHAGGFQVLGDWQETPQATVTASLPVLGRMLLSEDKGRSLVLGGDIRIDGDADFAQALLEILRDADFDPEEWLSRYIGDVPAFRVGQFMRGLLQQGRRGMQAAGRDTLRLLKDEGGDWVTRGEIGDWLDGVDKLRADTERLQARIKRLVERLEKEE